MVFLPPYNNVHYQIISRACNSGRGKRKFKSFPPAVKESFKTRPRGYNMPHAGLDRPAGRVNSDRRETWDAAGAYFLNEHPGAYMVEGGGYKMHGGASGGRSRVSNKQ